METGLLFWAFFLHPSILWNWSKVLWELCSLAPRLFGMGRQPAGSWIKDPQRNMGGKGCQLTWDLPQMLWAVGLPTVSILTTCRAVGGAAGVGAISQPCSSVVGSN